MSLASTIAVVVVASVVLHVQQIGSNQQEFFEFWAKEVVPLLDV